MIEFGALPPEINSARMYAGDGAASLVSAAAGWQAIASGLIAAAGGMGAVTAGLVGNAWSGPSSAMMGMSSMQFMEWVIQTAARAEMTAAAALAAADAHATAFAATIPPPEVERNQITTATLIATNFMGVNSAAIAASQAQYEEYWAQDASAMYTYAAANQTLAASLNAPPFLPAIPNTDPAGVGAQAAAVAQAGGEGVGNAANTVGGASSNLGSMSSAMGSAGSLVSAPGQLMSAIPQTLAQLASPLGSAMSGMFGNGGMVPMVGMAGSGYSPVSPVSSSSVSASMGRGMGFPSAIGSMGGQPTRLSVPSGWPGAVERSTVTKQEETAATALNQEEANSSAVGGAPRGAMLPPSGGTHSSSGVPAARRVSRQPKVVPHYP